MRAYHDRAPYVQPRLEPSGVSLSGIVLAGADLAATVGYGDTWPVPAWPGAMTVPAPPPEERMRLASTSVFRVARIEPHQNPDWPEPPGGFV